MGVLYEGWATVIAVALWATPILLFNKKAALFPERLLDRIQFDLFKGRHFDAFNCFRCIFLRIFELLLIRFFTTDKYEYCKQGD